jgi:hypothetical protein
MFDNISFNINMPGLWRYRSSKYRSLVQQNSLHICHEKKYPAPIEVKPQEWW